MQHWRQRVVAGIGAGVWQPLMGEAGEVVQATERGGRPEQLMLAILLGRPDLRRRAQSWRTLRNTALVSAGLIMLLLAMLLLTTHVDLGAKNSQLQAERSPKPMGSPEVTGTDQEGKIREILVPMGMYTLPHQPLNGDDPVDLSRRMSPPDPGLSARKKSSPRVKPGKPSRVERSGAPNRPAVRPHGWKGDSRAGG